MTNEMIIQIAQGKLKSLNPLSCRLFGKNEMKQAQIKMPILSDPQDRLRP